MGDSVRKYKSLEAEGEAREEFYKAQAKRYTDETAQYTPPHRRTFNGVDDYHRRAENTAFRTGDNFHEASKARRDHNTNYMSHFRGRWDLSRHEAVESSDEVKSEGWHATENAHRDLRVVSSKPPSLLVLQTFSLFCTNSPTLLVGGRSSSGKRGLCSTRHFLRRRSDVSKRPSFPGVMEDMMGRMT